MPSPRTRRVAHQPRREPRPHRQVVQGGAAGVRQPRAHRRHAGVHGGPLHAAERVVVPAVHGSGAAGGRARARRRGGARRENHLPGGAHAQHGHDLRERVPEEAFVVPGREPAEDGVHQRVRVQLRRKSAAEGSRPRRPRVARRAVLGDGRHRQGQLREGVQVRGGYREVRAPAERAAGGGHRLLRRGLEDGRVRRVLDVLHHG
mmetsp:Transcript_8502/g.35529  ORF Transcript_8502/g.35529 Transcript_8502/m.35529 type:complete len:204 (-) Transcript_8502:2309-2920(-)